MNSWFPSHGMGRLAAKAEHAGGHVVRGDAVQHADDEGEGAVCPEIGPRHRLPHFGRAQPVSSDQVVPLGCQQIEDIGDAVHRIGIVAVGGDDVIAGGRQDRRPQRDAVALRRL